jgi:biopolymer transport protein ExbD
MVAAFRRPYPDYRVNAYRVTTSSPMAEMNMTPLIDVLLVLLVMLIMAVPLSTDTLVVDLPSDRGAILPEPDSVSLTINAQGQPFWNGTAVTRPQLQQHLASAGTMPREPLVRFQPDPQTSYDDTVQVIALVGDAGLEKFAFIDNEQHRTFGR